MNLRSLNLAAVTAVAAAAAAVVAAPVAAQGVSDSVAFIKAVRDADGGKAMALLAAPGSTVLNARDGGTGETALHIAVRRRDLPWTNFMVQRGVDPELRDKSGDTPLGLAARLGFPEGARALIAGGARIDGPNARGETPLIIAVQARRLDLVQMLVRNGANPQKQDTSAGYSALDYARQDNRSGPIVRALEEKRAGPAARKLPAPAPTPAPTAVRTKPQ